MGVKYREQIIIPVPFLSAIRLLNVLSIISCRLGWMTFIYLLSSNIISYFSHGHLPLVRVQTCQNVSLTFFERHQWCISPLKTTNKKTSNTVGQSNLFVYKDASAEIYIAHVLYVDDNMLTFVLLWIKMAQWHKIAESCVKLIGRIVKLLNFTPVVHGHLFPGIKMFWTDIYYSSHFWCDKIFAFYELKQL